jgi:hypothetical protein
MRVGGAKQLGAAPYEPSLAARYAEQIALNIVRAVLSSRGNSIRGQFRDSLATWRLSAVLLFLRVPAA